VLTAKGGDRVSDHHASLPIAYRLYLPNKWDEHAGRRKTAHVPEDIDFKIEPRSRLSRSLRSAWRGCGASGAASCLQTGFFEWKAMKGAKAKQPYAIAMKDGAPFGIGGICENWKEPPSGEWVRTFPVITTDANELVAEIHDRMPLILAPKDYLRWLGDESDPRDLMRPFPSEPMRMWPISTRVNKPENDDPSILEPVELATDAV
jgi:putative SOS response-associated peptidase YedK